MSLPETEAWPDLATLFDRAGSTPRPDWELPVITCQAVGGEASSAIVAGAAIACLQLSIILVDDILDDDPRGAHHELGTGVVANMAQAYQAMSISLIDRATISHIQKARASAVLSKAALATAAGQNIDVQNMSGEENYWRVVQAKSTPFYGAAFEIGAIFASAQLETNQMLHNLGVTIGEIIQIEDDLNDALAVPANADWKKGRNNLLMLYATTANFPEKERFQKLLTDIDKPEALIEAQQILVSCGAVSYAIYQLISRSQQAVDLLDKIPLQNPQILHELMEKHAESLRTILRLSKVDLPSDISTLM